MNAPKKDQKTILEYLEQGNVKTGIAAVAGKYLSADRMLRLCVNAVKKTPLLMRCDPQTVLGAMMASAALGLEPNTVQQQAFLIPYKRRAKVGNDWVDVYDCQFQIGARGFVTLAYRSPKIRSLAAEAVHEGDKFEHMFGSNTFLSHAKALKDRGELIGSYSFVRLDGGVETACVLPLDEIEKIRARSETYRALTAKVAGAESEKDQAKAERALAETPWVMWIDDMAAKSAIKKHAKQLPLSSGDALSVAANLDSNADIGAVDLSAMTDPDLVREVMDGDTDPPALTDDRSQSLHDMGIGTKVKEPVRTPVSRSQKGARTNVNQAEAKSSTPPAEPRQDSPPAASSTGDAPTEDGEVLFATEGERAFVRSRLEQLNITVEDACASVGISEFEKLTPDGFIAMRDFIRERSR